MRVTHNPGFRWFSDPPPPPVTFPARTGAARCPVTVGNRERSEDGEHGEKESTGGRHRIKPYAPP